MTVRAQTPARCTVCDAILLPDDIDGYCWADSPPTKPTPGSVLAERVERVLVALEGVDFHADEDLWPVERRQGVEDEAVAALSELRVAWLESPQRRWALEDRRAA